jgi:hypothetical protein
MVWSDFRDLFRGGAMTALPAAVIVPVHHDGWAHLTQSSADPEHAFGALGLRSRLQMLRPGVAMPIDKAR